MRLGRAMLNCKLRSFCAVVLCMNALTPSRAFANELFDLSLEQLLKVKIKVSTQQNESLLSVPSAVTVFTQEQWRRMGITRLEELMNFVPGYQSYRGDGAAVQWQFSSRGRRTGYSSLEILILVDGLRVNEDWAGGTFYNTVFSLENAQRVEFLRGPGSAMYGGNAFLGVINIITKNSNEIAVELGDGDQQKVAAHWQTDIGQLNLGLSLEHLHDGGKKLLAYNSDPSRQAEELTEDGFDFESVRFNASYKNFSLSANHTESEEDGFYNVGRLLGNKQQETQRSWLKLKYQREISQVLDVDLIVGYFHREHSSQGVQDLASQLFLRSIFEERELVVDSKFNFHPNQHSRGVLGFEWRQPNHLAASQQLRGPVNLNTNIARLGKRRIGGVFGQWQQDLSDRWQLTGGLRLDSYSDFGRHLSPRLGLIYSVDTEKSFKVLYGEAFRAPVWLELFAVNNPVAQGNPNLKPETSETWELIWTQMKSMGLIQATVFHVHIDDASRRNPVSLMFENTHTETVGGLELEFRSQLRPELQLSTTATWISNAAKRVSTEANVLASLSLLYQKNKFSASLQAIYQGERDNISAANDPSLPSLESRNTLATHVQYSASKQVEIYFSAKNILDDESYSAADNPLNPIGVPNRGREALMGLRWSY